jgi:uncharacterized damage-inducible protein DinB
MAKTRTHIRIVLRMLDQAYNQRSWHGPNLRGSLRGISAKQADWSPGKNRHSIRDLALHAAYWKYVVRRQLLGEKRGSFPVAGSNWFDRVEKGTHAWKADLALLEDTHRSLRRAVSQVDDAALRRKPSRSSVPMLDVLLGVAAHDLYHAGQIQLIKRMHQKRGRP